MIVFKQLSRRILLAALATTATIPAARAASLVMYYPFEASGTPTSYTDVVGGNVATVSDTAAVGTSGTVPAGIGSTRSLYDSGTGYLSLGTFADAVHKGTGSGLSLSFWVNAASQTNRTMYGEGSTAENISFFSLGTGTTDGTKLRFFFRGSNGSTIADKTSTSSINTGTFHHLVWTDDGGGNAKLYVDGVQDATDFTYTVPTASLLANFNTSTIAALTRQSGVVQTWGAGGARMDDFAMWDAALPASSVTDLFTGAKTPMTVAIPEPSGLALLGLGGILLLLRGRRQRA